MAQSPSVDWGTGEAPPPSRDADDYGEGGRRRYWGLGERQRRSGVLLGLVGVLSVYSVFVSYATC